MLDKEMVENQSEERKKSVSDFLIDERERRVRKRRKRETK
jgi:hypothetical protein